MKQVKGEYKIKNDDLKWLADEAKGLMKDFASVTLTHVRREQNKRADELCNIALDGAKPKAPAAAKAPKKPAATVGDGRVRDDALECLRSARGALGPWRESAEPGAGVGPALEHPGGGRRLAKEVMSGRAANGLVCVSPQVHYCPARVLRIRMSVS